MGFAEGGGLNVVTITNLALRVIQFIIGLVVLVIYATQYSYKPWLVAPDLRGKFPLGVAAGALAMITTPVFAVLPFFMSYYPVALGCIWDLIVMCVWAATFGTFKYWFNPGGETGRIYKQEYEKVGISGGRVDLMQATVWIDLVGMLLWIITFLMGLVTVLWHCVKGRGGRGATSHV